MRRTLASTDTSQHSPQPPCPAAAQPSLDPSPAPLSPGGTPLQLNHLARETSNVAHLAAFYEDVPSSNSNPRFPDVALHLIG
ncbi:uncharacterized protein C2845_PM13G17150 [Panicum miliaceum]|uniref:Uncharacterized protein n=1 Tax=Panicum miliaceum TaxID=4540 RepID=A0A3L6RMV2_PANMI|nr:uncharacterized protein C2845_PM13G17150 [Panicum miliaceum]